MDQKKELLNKNDKINCLKKELNKMKLIVAKKGEELFENKELLEIERMLLLSHKIGFALKGWIGNIRKISMHQTKSFSPM